MHETQTNPDREPTRKRPYLVLNAFGLHDGAKAMGGRLRLELVLERIVADAADGATYAGIVSAIHPRGALTNKDFVLEANELALSVLTVEAEGNDARNENIVECAVRAAAALADPHVERVVLVGYRGPLAGLARLGKSTGKELAVADFARTGVRRYEGLADEVILLGFQHLRVARRRGESHARCADPACVLCDVGA